MMLGKMHKDNDKFSCIGDNFKFKDTIFYNKYRHISLPKDLYI